MTTFPGHAAGAFLAIEIVSYIDPSLKLDKTSVLMLGTIAGVLPDIDLSFYVNSVKDHHDTPTHTPLYWLALFIVLLVIYHSNTAALAYVWAAFIGITSHMFLDWYGGRICGIRLFFPFSKKRYSLFPLERKKFKQIDFSKKYREFYTNNRVLLWSEILIVVVAIAVLVIQILNA